MQVNVPSRECQERDVVVVLYVVTSRLLVNGRATSTLLDIVRDVKTNFRRLLPALRDDLKCRPVDGGASLRSHRAVFTKSALRHVQREGGGVSPLG